MRAVVIEDSRTQALRLCRFLEREGFSVEVAEDGVAGLAICRELTPDVVVSDVMMPGIDGFEVCRRIKADPALAEVPVILLTSLADPRDVARALAAGADNFVTKPYDEARLIDRIHRTINARNTPSGTSEVTVRGERFRVAASSDQTLRLLVSCLEDVSDRNAELEANRQELALANEQRQSLIEAERAARSGREELLAIVAHDLRAPLGVVVLSSAALRDAAPPGPEGEEVRVLAGMAERAAGQMGKLIRDLLDASIVEAGRLRFDVRDHEPGALLDEATALFAPLAAQKSITLHKELLGDQGIIRCDRDRILQVLSNLISNAIKFTPEGGVITLRSQGSADEVKITVADNGPGIAESDLHQIFERHWSGRGKSGAGLGLFIAKGIVEAHHGHIDVKSRVGAGSAFSLLLPRAPALSQTAT